MINPAGTHQRQHTGRRFAWVAALPAAVLIAAACGGGEATPAEPEPNPAADAAVVDATPAPPPDAAATDESQASDSTGLPRMAAAEATRPRTVAPVAFERLVALLPQVAGWARDEPRGQQHTAPVAYASARATYRPVDLDAEGPSVTLEIVDSGFQPLLLTPHEMFLAPGYDERSRTGFVRAGTIAGSPSYSRWDGARRHGEVVAIVNRRFIVSAVGAEVSGIEPINAIMSRVDLGTLGRVR